MTPNNRPDTTTAPTRGPRLEVAQTEHLTIEPRVRTYVTRRYLWAIVALPIFALAGLLAVREVSRIEETLSAEGAKAVRVLVYDLKRGEDLRVPIEPGTDVIRVVAHAVTEGRLALTPHASKVTVAAQGDRGTLREEVTLQTPGTTSRVTPEEPSLTEGDPIGFNIDVHGVGTGEVTMSLDQIDGADGLLVRVYRREALDRTEAARRVRTLDEARREHLAARAWELDWIDLDEDEQQTLVAARWRKIAAYHGSRRDLRAHAIALAPAPLRPRHASDDAFVLSATLRGDERAAIFARSPTKVRAVAEDPSAALTATMRHEDGRVEVTGGRGEVTIEAPGPCGIEIASATATSIVLRATEPKAVDAPSHVVAWRATPARPALVTAGETPLVLRIAARRPVDRAAAGLAAITLDVEIRGEDGRSSASPTLHLERARAPFDRYDGASPIDAPTEKAVLHVLVPARATVAITPREPAIDLSLAELDPDAAPLPTPVRADGTAAASSQGGPRQGAAPVTRRLGEVDWGGFRPRRPTNAAAFEPDGRRVLRIARRLAPATPPDAAGPAGKAAHDVLRVRKAGGVPARTLNGHSFELASVPFDVHTSEAAILPVRLLADEAMDVVVRVDGKAPRRRLLGVSERVSVPRLFSIGAGESQAVIVFGDDLAPGPHTLTFECAPGKWVWVHAPWAREHHASPGPRAPRWTSGDFEE